MRRRLLLFKIILPVLSILVVLVVTEFLLRWQRDRAIKRDPFWNASVALNRKSADPKLIYEQTPGAKAIREGVEVRINPQGFRDRPFDDNDGTTPPLRIVVLGDSVAWGWGVVMEQSFPTLLQNDLLWIFTGPALPSSENREVIGESLDIERARHLFRLSGRVYNMAVAGYSTSQEIELLKTRALELHPDLVIISYVLNDPDEYDGGLARYFESPKIELLRRAKNAIYKVRDNSLLAEKEKQDYPHFVHGLYAKEIEANFKELGEIAKANKLPILVAVTPYFGYIPGKPNPWGDIVDQIRGLSEKNGLLFLDLYPAFKDIPPEMVRFDWWHPNETGHVIIASELFKYLKAQPQFSSKLHLEEPSKPPK